MSREFRTALGRELEELAEAGLLRSLPQPAGAGGEGTVEGKTPWLNFASSDYLGLSHHPEVIEAGCRAFRERGAGAGASRLLCPDADLQRDLEARLASWKRREAALVFPSGYAAAAGTIPVLVGAEDLVVLDRLSHASLIDGARASKATLRVFPHNDLHGLEEILRRYRPRSRRALVVTESVFSMDGDITPLQELVALKERYEAWCLVDEAHAEGVFGRTGAGIIEALGLEGRIEVELGTLSKALGSGGGFVAGDRELIDLLINRARPFVYSTALPPPSAGAAKAALALLTSGEGTRRRERLREIIALFGGGQSERSPIFPVICGEERRATAVAARLRKRGIFAPAIRFPTVPKGAARLRISLCSFHTPEEIRLLQAELEREE
ncbi:aminotransferase class I/II-fold pyridoxal phosphate-dependent enzyme [Methylacidimicrobium tartarophylax]|uniref:8-amino-7-oxononanoate synthase n=1 Tax=Methylacidimicrobium tartarophylax TaxID=1041768 RepID=A0A5E6M590_9BACT|nr:8-amino-7-oxononanoate synthase [Methylacidimicrobium tartarophylax]VVM04743.1 8-amino-7-oxononanoate synthase [Methylacidimicrobium tartarophylax]